VYNIRFLPIGRYELTVNAPGFTTQTVPAYALEIAQTVKFDVKLTVGSQAQTVTVNESTAPIVNTENPTR
jgi:Carboxypeptidase regulatory-like domain